MTFFLVYLFTQIEAIAALFALGGSLFTWSLIFALATYPTAFAVGNKETFNDWLSRMSKFRKWNYFLATLGAIFFVISALLPNKKDLAIIVAAGVTYEVLTSEGAKEVGGKALELLKKQMDDALKDDKALEGLKSEAVKTLKEQAKQAL